MEQQPIQNQNSSFFKKNQNFLIILVAIVVIVIIISATRDKSPNSDENLGENDDISEEMDAQKEQENGQPRDQSAGKSSSQSSLPGSNSSPVSGNLSISGTLQESDDSSKGNLVLESNQGRVYIVTKRDFSAQVGGSVTLLAEGTLESFAFLGLEGAGDVAGETTMPAIGGVSEEHGEFSFIGRLEASDNPDRGNYQITSPASKVYLKSVNDYSAWVGTEVELDAAGTIESFAQARLKQI